MTRTPGWQPEEAASLLLPSRQRKKRYSQKSVGGFPQLFSFTETATGAAEKATGAPSSTLPGKPNRRTGQESSTDSEAREGTTRTRTDGPEGVDRSHSQMLWFSDRSLVRDQALPLGHEEAFVSLPPFSRPRRHSGLGWRATENVQAALDLHEREKQDRLLAKRSEVARAQFMLSAPGFDLKVSLMGVGDTVKRSAKCLIHLTFRRPRSPDERQVPGRIAR